MGYGLGLLWVLASTVGWAVGGPVGAAMGRSGDIIMAGYLGVALGGIVTGVLQWLVLRRKVRGSGWWVLASVAAASVAGSVAFGVGLLNPPVGWVAGVGPYGTVVGLLQWLVLRRRIARAGWWVFASTAGWLAGGPGVGFVGWLAAGPLGSFLSWPALGMVYGAVTGIALVWLWRRNVGPRGDGTLHVECDAVDLATNRGGQS